MVLALRAASRAASVLALATVVVVPSFGCGRDFDGLFVDGGGSPASSGASSGTSGSPGTPACPCAPCAGPSCDFTCPPGCASCTCDVFTCVSDKCDVHCGPGAACEIACGAHACTLDCAEGAECLCTGDLCGVTCHDADKTTCKKGVSCNRDCPK